jgi:predicted O-methyltransferase YrrM
MFTDVGEPFWREAGVAHRIRLRIQPALQTLDNTLGLSRTPVIRMTSENAQAIKEFNRRVHHDPRVEIAMLPVGEGLMLLRVVR